MKLFFSSTGVNFLCFRADNYFCICYFSKGGSCRYYSSMILYYFRGLKTTSHFGYLDLYCYNCCLGILCCQGFTVGF